jgi:GH18 family chitinase
MRITRRTIFSGINLFFTLCFCISVVNAQQQYENHVVAGFYPYTKDYVLKPENIQLQNLTHLIYCFAGPRADGSISTETGSYHNPTLVSRTHAEGRKFIIMMGGGLQSGGFHAMASSATTRTIFINTLVEWCTTYGYDGVNIDWEYPGDNNKNEDRENLTALITEMRQAFNTFKNQTGKYLEISIDVHSSLFYAQWVDFATLKNYVDWFGLMSYDFAGNWSYTLHAAHNAPLYCGPAEICDRYLSVDRGVKNLTESLGIPSSQIVMGVAFYGREFYNSALYQTPREGGAGVPYYDIEPLISNGWTRYWDEQSRVPYLLKNSGSGFMSYDDATSLKEKTDYIKEKELLGTMIWEITQDVDKVTKQQPLLKVIGENLVDVDLNTEGKPTVAITSPANNYVFTPGSNVTITASATVEAGFYISKVEFYQNGNLLGTDTSAPYTYTWQHIPLGKYTLKAIAYSSNAKSTESQSVSITDGALPSVTEMFDDFSYSSSSDPALQEINSWSVVDGPSGPPSGAIYSKDLITFYADPQNSNNKIMGVATRADNNPSNTRHSRIETDIMPYRNGTFAARVYFDDTPALYGDGNVETFYTINSYATCNQADLYSECDFEYLPWDSWHWERQKTMYTTTWETCEIRTHDKVIKSYEGWHDLLYTAENGQPVKYYIDGQLFATHNQYQPDSDVNISFANWIYQNITGGSSTVRTTTMQVDWVYHAKDVILSRADVLALVSNFRNNGILRKNLAGQTVGGSVNPVPTVTITSPLNGASFMAPANITINATATDTNGTIASVAFYNGTQLLGIDTTNPYSYTWNNVSAGQYTIIARATDNGGASSSAQVSITVTGNTAPTVTITSPTNGTTLNAPASLLIKASASDANGSIKSVAFYNGNQLLNVDMTSPYEYQWTNIATGNYTITAVATDNENATTTSSPVTITVVTQTPVQLQVVYKTIVAWNTGFQGEVRITNNSSAVATNWAVSFDCPHNIAPIWDAIITNHTGNRYEIKGTSTTQTIPPHQSVVFGFIGNITAGQPFAPPANVSVQGSGQSSSARSAYTEESLNQELSARSYPNPFNDVVTIEFTLPTKSYVELGIYDMKGIKLSTLLNNILPAGNHRTIWNATSYEHGVFFFRLKSNNKLIRERIIKKE